MIRRALLLPLLASSLLPLAGCSSGPQTILADDEATCRYVAAASDRSSYERCKARLAADHAQALAMNASAIQGYALLKGPEQPTDVTGSIPVPAKKP